MFPTVDILTLPYYLCRRRRICLLFGLNNETELINVKKLLHWFPKRLWLLQADSHRLDLET
jgi:3-deoxy-D-manno-octulosonic acid (KDO) 8-phosphate synthase